MSNLSIKAIGILAVFLIAHSLSTHAISQLHSTLSPTQTRSYPSQTQNNQLSLLSGYLQNLNSHISNLVKFIRLNLEVFDSTLLNLVAIVPGAAAQDVYLTAHFDGECPQGWQADESVNGMFISSTIDDSEIGDSGGQPTVTLQASQMPAHTHKILTPKGNPESYKNIEDAKFIVEEANFNNEFPDNIKSTSHQYQLVGSDELPTLGEVSFAGGGQAHSNMPPYTKRMACKIKSTDLITHVQLGALEASIQTSLDDQKTEFDGKITELDDKITAAVADTEKKMRELEESLNNKLQEHKDEMNRKFEQYKKDMLPFHILACVAFGCFVLSIIFWLVILKKVKTPEYNSKVLYSPRTTRP